jgi:hypothetical protein
MGLSDRRPSAADPGPSGAHDYQPAVYRYGVVLLLVFVLLVFLILAPDADWSHAVAFALEAAVLLVVVATSRARSEIRRARALVVGVGAVIGVIAVASGALSVDLTFLLSGLLTAAIPLALIGGLLRLIRSRGVTAHAVAGALAIYLLLGLLFAWTIGFVSHVDSTPYFVERTGSTVGDRVYFSLATLTTTGYGDFTAATSLGHALAVVEMLLGQIYLVTVIGILVGSIARR